MPLDNEKCQFQSVNAKISTLNSFITPLLYQINIIFHF